MSCCCKNVLKLCSARTCPDSVILLPGAAFQAGTHQLVLEFLESRVIIESTHSEDEQLSFSTEQLNEYYTYRGYILNPDGTRYIFTGGEFSDDYNDDFNIGGEFECIQFNTIPILTMSA